MSDRGDYSWSNRWLLANALEEDMQSDEEIMLLAEYQKIVKQIEHDQERFHETRQLIGQIYSHGSSNYYAMKKSLEESADRIADCINENDRKLINLEATTALQNVLAREKMKAFERMEQRGKEALAAYRERETQKQIELMQQYQNRVEERRRIREQAQVSQEPIQVGKESVQETITKKEPHVKWKKDKSVIVSIAFLLTSALLVVALIMICILASDFSSNESSRSNNNQTESTINSSNNRPSGSKPQLTPVTEPRTGAILTGKEYYYGSEPNYADYVEALINGGADVTFYDTRTFVIVKRKDTNGITWL